MEETKKKIGEVTCQVRLTSGHSAHWGRERVCVRVKTRWCSVCVRQRAATLGERKPAEQPPHAHPHPMMTEQGGKCDTRDLEELSPVYGDPCSWRAVD